MPCGFPSRLPPTIAPFITTACPICLTLIFTPFNAPSSSARASKHCPDCGYRISSKDIKKLYKGAPGHSHKFEIFHLMFRCWSCNREAIPRIENGGAKYGEVVYCCGCCGWKLDGLCEMLWLREAEDLQSGKVSKEMVKPEEVREKWKRFWRRVREEETGVRTWVDV